MKKVTAFAAMVLAFVAQAEISNVKFTPSGVPAFVGEGEFPIGTLTLQSTRTSPADKVKVSIAGTNKKDLKALRLGKAKGVAFGDTVSFNVPVKEGECSYTVFAEVPKTADLTRKLMIEGASVRLGSIVTRPHQLITDANRKSKNFRIPGIVETDTGALVAVFDNRFHQFDQDRIAFQIQLCVWIVSSTGCHRFYVRIGLIFGCRCKSFDDAVDGAYSIVPVVVPQQFTQRTQSRSCLCKNAENAIAWWYR